MANPTKLKNASKKTDLHPYLMQAYLSGRIKEVTARKIQGYLPINFNNFSDYYQELILETYIQEAEQKEAYQQNRDKNTGEGLSDKSRSQYFTKKNKVNKREQLDRSIYGKQDESDQNFDQSKSLDSTQPSPSGDVSSKNIESKSQKTDSSLAKSAKNTGKEMVKKKAFNVGKKAAGTAAKTAAKTAGRAAATATASAISSVAAFVAPWVGVGLLIIGVFILTIIVTTITLCKIPFGAEKILGLEYCDSLGIEQIDVGRGSTGQAQIADMSAVVLLSIPTGRLAATNTLTNIMNSKLIPQGNLPTVNAFCTKINELAGNGLGSARGSDCYQQEVIRANNTSVQIMENLATQNEFTSIAFTGWVEGVSHTSNSGEHGPAYPTCHQNPGTSTCGQAIDFNAINGVDIGEATPEANRQSMIDFAQYISSNFSINNAYGPQWLVSGVGESWLRYLNPQEATHFHVRFTN